MDELVSQINQMKEALAAASEDDKPALLLMISQLEELVDPNLQHSSAEASTDFCSQVSNVEEDEFLRFQREISALEASFDENKGDVSACGAGSSSSLYDNETNDGDEEKQKSVDIQSELSALEGMKCKAPHEHHWGQVGYYNAIVLNVEQCTGDSLDSIMVRVLFSQPLAESMLPCPFFMEGRCRFDDSSCKFSHGELVALSELREYAEPDFSKIKAGSRVLAKYSDGLWYKASVSEVLESGDCKIKYDTYKEVTTVALHDTTPLYDEEEDTDSSSESEDESSTSDEEDNEVQEEVRNLWPFQMKASGPLGEWEKYTKGIGSKLMAKMGYVVGSGLGRRGQGRVEPIDAVVLPPGRSLDACMEIKEKAGDGNLFSAEKRLKRIKKKQEQLAKREEAKQKSEESVFNFLNANLSKSASALKKDTVSKKDLTKETEKNLNKKMLSIGATIKQANIDIARLRESIKRHQGRDDATAERFKLKLESMEKHLSELKQSELHVQSEQRSRCDNKKLSIF